MVTFLKLKKEKDAIQAQIKDVKEQYKKNEDEIADIIARKNVKENVAKCCDLVPIEIAEDAEDLIADIQQALDKIWGARERRVTFLGKKSMQKNQTKG